MHSRYSVLHVVMSDEIERGGKGGRRRERGGGEREEGVRE